MKIDHSEFIRRHHKSAQTPSPAPQKKVSYDSMFALAFMGVFLAFLFVVLTDNEMTDIMKIVTVLVFIIGSVIGMILYRGYKTQRALDEELDLIREVMEGSRGARLITDSADNTLYYNQKFERLCRGVGPPAFSSLLKLFDYREEVAAHFRLLADQAHRGLTDSIELFSKYEDNERWLLVTAQPIAGRAGYVHWRLDDVTEKHTADTAMRDEREKLQQQRPAKNGHPEVGMLVHEIDCPAHHIVLRRLERVVVAHLHRFFELDDKIRDVVNPPPL